MIHGYTLAIPIDELTFYYSNALVTCLMEEISVSLHVKIPLRRVGKNWSVHSLTPVHFAYENNTCAIKQPSEVAVATELGQNQTYHSISSRVGSLAMVATQFSQSMSKCLHSLFSTTATPA